MAAKTQPARGMRDFLPADVRRREYVIRRIKDVYERYGFEPLETPAVENIETLLGKYGEEGNQLIFKILKRGEHERTGEADLALRYDLTVPLARVVAEYGERLPKFFKRYQIQPVWRADRPARGRFREFYQCDVDCIGTRSSVVEAELCAAASDALTALGFCDFTIRLNHRQVLAGVLEAAGIAADKHSDALVALDKMDKIGREGVLREVEERKVFSTEEGKRVFELLLDLMSIWIMKSLEDVEIQVRGDFNEKERNEVNEQILKRISGFIGNHNEGQRGLEELKQILELVNNTQAKGKIEIDLSLARGLSYYTGAIMEISVPDLAGSLGGGGRYDNLVGMFSGKDIPACGFSLGLERIIVVMTERAMFPTDLESAAADVLVTVWNEESIKDSLAFAAELRRSAPRLRVDVYPEADKLGKQLKYASARGVSFVVVIGDDERGRGEVALKNMTGGEQRTLERAQAGAAILEALRPGA
jgi:histidyl-tRNA synthetase